MSGAILPPFRCCSLMFCFSTISPTIVSPLRQFPFGDFVLAFLDIFLNTFIRVRLVLKALENLLLLNHFFNLLSCHLNYKKPFIRVNTIIPWLHKYETKTYTHLLHILVAPLMDTWPPCGTSGNTGYSWWLSAFWTFLGSDNCAYWSMTKQSFCLINYLPIKQCASYLWMVPLSFSTKPFICGWYGAQKLCLNPQWLRLRFTLKSVLKKIIICCIPELHINVSHIFTWFLNSVPWSVSSLWGAPNLYTKSRIHLVTSTVALLFRG